MNRADLAKQVLLYDSLASVAKDRAAGFRAELDIQARHELAEQGMAPTWRLPDVGTVTLPVSQESIALTNVAALLEWAVARHPDGVEMVPALKPAFVAGLEKRLGAAGDLVCDRETGELVPGYRVRLGGLPQALSIRPSSDAKAVMRQHAEGLLLAFEATLTGEASA